MIQYFIATIHSIKAELLLKITKLKTVQTATTNQSFPVCVAALSMNGQRPAGKGYAVRRGLRRTHCIVRLPLRIATRFPQSCYHFPGVCHVRVTALTPVTRGPAFFTRRQAASGCLLSLLSGSRPPRSSGPISHLGPDAAFSIPYWQIECSEPREAEPFGRPR